MPGIQQSLSTASLSSMDRDISLNSLTLMNGQQSSVSTLQQKFKPSHPFEDDCRHLIELSSKQADSSLSRLRASSVKKKKRRKQQITANLTQSRYEVVRYAAEKMGFTISRDDDPFSYLMWSDAYVSTDRIADLKPYQRLNHFPGMGEISRKDSLARNLVKMQKEFPEEYNFIPRTWILPADYASLQIYAKSMRSRKKMKTYIVKPSNGAQGHGINLYRNAEKIPASEHFIVQQYIHKPLLLDGYKFDLRVYVLVTSCDPLRIFLFNDGLVRLATEKYLLPHESNISHLYMHLTNYSVNKHNEFYKKNVSPDAGSKRSIRYFNEHLREKDIDVALLWRNIADMIIKTLLVAEPHVLHAYRMCRPGVPSYTDSVCFEVLGFDVLIDQKQRPWLLEINRSPSFGTDEQLDFDIKSALLVDTFRLLNMKVSDKRRNIAAQKAETQRRLFKGFKKADGLPINDTKKIKNVEKKKEELNELLTRIRKASFLEDFENRNCGGFHRIFPCDDQVRHAKYCQMLEASFNLFLSGRGKNIHKEIERNYNNKLREDDVLDMIAECEAEEKGIKTLAGLQAPGLRGPKEVQGTLTYSHRSPLQSMPETLARSDDEEDKDDEEDASEDEGISFSQHHIFRHQLSEQCVSGTQTPAQRSSSGQSYGESVMEQSSRPGSGIVRINHQTHRTLSQVSGNGSYRSQSLPRAGSISNSKASCQLKSATDDSIISLMTKDREEELTKKTLSALNDMHIKFPGKTDSEADLLLDKLHENWKYHKPRVASYWLVKLDSIKRRKVIDIVRSNVKAVLQRIWRCMDIDSLRLCRIFSRIFNRLLWSHGQGLWNCFSPINGNSWEKIFSHSSEVVSEMEMNCCRRIVQLCQDCLLIVYQFAAEARSVAATAFQAQEADETSQVQPQNGYLAARDAKAPSPWNPQTFSQRYTKLYFGRAELGS